MKSTTNDVVIPTTANYVHQGEGIPVVMIHGIAASLHDWDDLIPELAQNGYASYALDLLGHGESPKLNSRAYHIDWVFEHFLHWMALLRLTEPAVNHWAFPGRIHRAGVRASLLCLDPRPDFG